MSKSSLTTYHSNSLVIKERTPLRYALGIGLLALLPNLFILALNPTIFCVLAVSCLATMLLLSQTCAIEITPEGIRQRSLGITAFTIKWQDISQITYHDAFPGPRYKIRSAKSRLAAIELPINDVNFPLIKQALAEKGIVLAKSRVSAKIFS